MSGYRGERTIGGPLVWDTESDELLDKHLDIFRLSPGGFDWGPDADVDRACQLAIALLADVIRDDVAVWEYHLFAENYVRRELTGDEWEASQNEIRDFAFREEHDNRDYPENATATLEELTIEEIDPDDLSIAEEVVLAERYEDELWIAGSRRKKLIRLHKIRTGELDPAAEPLTWNWLSDWTRLSNTQAFKSILEEFETMGEFTGWVLYSTDLTQLPGIGEKTATHLRRLESRLVKWFGGRENIPYYDDDQTSLDGLC